MSVNDSDYDSEIAADVANESPYQLKPKDYDVDGIKRITKQWQRYCINVSSLNGTEPFKTAPDVKLIRGFLKWRVKKGKARLDERITVSTLSKEFEQLQRAVKFKIDHTYHAGEKHDIAQYIKELSFTHGASTKKRTKTVALYRDIEDCIHYGYCCDEKGYSHPRILLQLVFFFILSAYTGLRPGEIVESSSHRNKNEGILYKDVTLFLNRRENAAPRYMIRVRVRNRKFRRGNEGLQQSIDLHEETEPEYIHACPVRLFLSFAMADEAFEPWFTWEEIDRRTLSPSAASRCYPIRKQVQDIPVIRAACGTAIHPTRILSASALHHLLVEFGQRCGYKLPLTCYSFRRGFANGIQGKASAPRLRQLMGHTNDGTIQSYLSEDVGIDAQNAVRNLPQDHARLDFTISIAFSRDVGAPTPSSNMLGQVPLTIPKERLDALSIAFPKRSRQSLRNLIRKSNYQNHRQRYFSDIEAGRVHPPNGEAQVAELLDGVDEAHPHEIQSNKDAIQLESRRLRPSSSELFKIILKFDTYRRAVIESFFPISTGVDAAPTSLSLAQAVAPLIELARPVSFRPKFPCLSMAHGRKCAYCVSASDAELKSDPTKTRRRYHVVNDYLEYARKHTKKNHFICHDCFDHVPDREFHTHDQLHRQESVLYCGILIWRHLLVRPGRCPFCIKPSFSQSFDRWYCAKQLASHIKSHIEKVKGESVPCPHWGCNGLPLSADLLTKHIQVTHGIQLGAKAEDSTA
ncbi:hypothetical protein PMIN04_012523 [Paraphaeosphaeria minitans]|uniref:Uncharacterized protein n=1 Tax=Paraphaeosphaeria minitans TaxID=565426 RepID=A0A9P6KPE5_9PLEO|nr:hypothetical protein PMIN01_08034 [Paraphaeosphaeria minitans]